MPKVFRSLCAGPIFVLSAFLSSFPREAYFRVNAETSRPPSRPIVPPLPTAACPPAGARPAGCHSGEELQPAAVARGGPAGAALLSRCHVMPLRSFPPSWVNQGCKERVGTTRICIFSRCCHSAPGTRSSITLTLLPGVGWCCSPE